MRYSRYFEIKYTIIILADVEKGLYYSFDWIDSWVEQGKSDSLVI